MKKYSIQQFKKSSVQIFCYQAELYEEGQEWVELSRLGLPLDLLHKMAGLEIIEVRKNRVRSEHIGRIFKALRLHRTLGINLAAAGIILQLLDEMEKLRDEIEQLKKNL